MPYIAVNAAEPAIRGLLRYRPETGRPLSELAEVLLPGPGTLARGERELIGAYVRVNPAAGANRNCQFRSCMGRLGRRSGPTGSAGERHSACIWIPLNTGCGDCRTAACRCRSAWPATLRL
jgi:hypothetical protein